MGRGRGGCTCEYLKEAIRAQFAALGNRFAKSRSHHNVVRISYLCRMVRYSKMSPHGRGGVATPHEGGRVATPR